VFPGLPFKHGYEGMIRKLNKYVAYSEGITVKDLVGKSRLTKVNRARQVCMYVLKKHTKLTLTEISAEYNRHHATTIHSFKVIENELTYDKELRAFVLELKRELAYLNRSKVFATQVDVTG
jgi:chromosomal replication initiator protein